LFSISQTAGCWQITKESDIADCLATNTTNSVTGKAVVEHTKKLAVVKRIFNTCESNRTRVDTSMSGSGALQQHQRKILSFIN
jgi:hypothetical protein